MRSKLAQIWQEIWRYFKWGIIPLFIVRLLLYIFCWTWGFTDENGFHLMKNPFFDVPITAAIVFFSSCLFGYLVSRSWYEKFAKTILLRIPVIGGLIVAGTLPKGKRVLVEVKTTWGPTPEECCWEYALETCDPWEEDSLTWHRVHTLGWTGKLICRVGDKNIRELKIPQHKAWATIITLGLL